MTLLLKGLNYGFDEKNTLIEEAEQTPKFAFSTKIDPLFPRIEKKEAQ